MRNVTPLNDKWLFHEGEIEVPEASTKSPMYIQAKTERMRTGPAARHYNDGTEYYGMSGLISHDRWDAVTLPHDYIIAQTPEQKNNDTLGYFDYHGAWYRKHFSLDQADEGRRICLLFEGVATHSTVFVNGCRMLHNHCGYNSFEVDVTNVVEFGADNVVAVHIEKGEHEGWWYEGAGIYRPVWLKITEPVAVDQYGVFVHPEKMNDSLWSVPVEVAVRNDGYEQAHIRIRSEIFAPDGSLAAQAECEAAVEDISVKTVSMKAQVENPLLWDIDSPNLYSVRTTVSDANGVLDEVHDRFGFRTFRFDAQTGFWLNGRNVKIKGVCCHQDYGLTGKAVPARAQRYRLELLKEMGANGYRTAHYPQHEKTMDYLDELGFLVMDETRWFETTPDGMKQLEMLVKRDRNRPGVILWSVGNEEPLHQTQAGKRTARAMIAALKKLDPTRPVTTAVSHEPLTSTVMDVVDVIGINYNITHYDGLHEKYPDKPIVNTESCATGTTRGWYLPDCPERGYIYGYDHDSNKSFLAREKNWKFFMERPWIAGEYQWAGIEHRGETVWPRLCSQSGALDLFLNKKDAFYQNQSHWKEEPMVHMLPHWNWSGHEGEEIRVSVYTNCEKVRLYRDGQLVGEKQVEKWGHAEWQVVYQPGRLDCEGVNGNEVVCRDSVETTGPAAKLRLRSAYNEVSADGQDVVILTCDCLDAEGRVVPDASPMVQFNCNGLGTVIATGSDICDHTPPSCPDRKMRMGLISVLVRAGHTAGKLSVYANAEGLQGARAEIEVVEG